MNLLTAPLEVYQPVSRRGFFELLGFTALSYFVTRKTQAKLLAPKLEGKAIPQGLYISQVCGRGRPFYPQEPIKTVKLKSIVEGQQKLGPCVVCGMSGYNLSMGGPDICPACDCGLDPHDVRHPAAGPGPCPVGPQGPVGPVTFPDTAFYNAQPFPYKC